MAACIVTTMDTKTVTEDEFRSAITISVREDGLTKSLRFVAPSLNTSKDTEVSPEKQVDPSSPSTKADSDDLSYWLKLNIRDMTIEQLESTQSTVKQIFAAQEERMRKEREDSLQSLRQEWIHKTANGMC